ncbi:MAG: hypothetical protein V2I67_19065 [Thermoanaerobaculales bacterium]|jgi:hypothetical protein|nr:hypothetical protein [Thermoanaerobaculales bacterium]
MKRFVTFALVSALVLGASSIAYANICAFDAAPAATILFPFVTLDYNNPVSGLSTTFSITNVSSEAQVVHVTVWTDFTAAILDFNILLTGYDVISMNIRDILIDGQLPVTTWGPHAGNGAGLYEGIAPNGPVSVDNQASGATWINPGMAEPEPTNALGDRCNSSNPSYPGNYTLKIDPSFLGLFQGYLQVSQTVDRLHSNDCFKDPNYDGAYVLSPEPYWVERDTTFPTNMYITADVVENCNKLFPDSPGYFGAEVRYDNVLIGDVFWTSLDDRLSEASAAVHLEASVNLPYVNTPSPDSPFGVSFYHRYAWYLDATSDFREPLPTAWAFRYLGAGMDTIGTDIRVWKGSSLYNQTYDLERVGTVKVSPDSLVASNCHAYTYYAWDEEEMVTQVSTVPWSMPGGESVIPNLIPLETQQVPVDQFDTPGAFGWMLFVWPASNYPPATALFPPDDYYQTWMGVRYNAAGAWSAAMDAAVMANFNCFQDQVLPNLGINYQYVDMDGYVVPAGPMPVN